MYKIIVGMPGKGGGEGSSWKIDLLTAVTTEKKMLGLTNSNIGY